MLNLVVPALESVYIWLLLHLLLLISFKYYIKMVINLRSTRRYLIKPSLLRYYKAKSTGGIPSLVTHAKSEKNNMNLLDRIKQFRTLLKKEKVNEDNHEDITTFIKDNKVRGGGEEERWN